MKYWTIKIFEILEFEIFEKETYLNVEKIGTLKVEIWNVKILKILKIWK